MNIFKGIHDASVAPFRKREGQPYLQGTARNYGHAFFGDHEAQKFETKYLGDTPEGYRYPHEDTAPTSIIPMAAVPQMQQMPVAPQMQQGVSGDQTNEIMKLLMQRIAAGNNQQTL